MNRLLVPLLLAALWGGCGKDSVYVNISRAPVQVKPGDYKRVLGRWTRHKRILQQLDTTLDVHATLLSWEFRWAYTMAVSRWFRLSEKDKKKLWASQQQDLDAGVEFVVVSASSEPTWNDLEKGTPDVPGPGRPLNRSLWRISLYVDNAEPVTPAEVQAVEPISRLHRDMFPHIGYFHRLFLVRFPARTADGREVLPEAARKIRLRFSGSLGTAELTWNTTNQIVNE